MRRGIIFQKSAQFNFVAKKQVSIATSVIIRTLVDCSVSHVRMVVHDLKDPYFGDYFGKIDFVAHETNRLDFGQYVKSPFKIFKKVQSYDEVFPMFSPDNWEN